MNSGRERPAVTSNPCVCQRVLMQRRAVCRRTVLRGLMASGMAVSLSGCAWVDSKQRQLVYRPTLGQPADFAGLRTGDQSFLVELPQVGVTMPDRLHLWWMPNNDMQAPTLLYLHGTFRN